MMREIGTEATAGRFGIIIRSVGEVMAAREMGGMLTALGKMAAAGQFRPTIDATLAMATSGKLNATVATIIESWSKNVNISALNLRAFADAASSLNGAGRELQRLNRTGFFQPFFKAVTAFPNAKEVKDAGNAFQKAVNALRKVNISSLADYNKPEVKKQLNDIVIAFGKLVASPPVRNVLTPTGTMISSGIVSFKLRNLIASAGAALAGDLANAMPENADNMLTPVADAVIKALGVAINTGQMNGPIKAMRDISKTSEFGALKTAMQAMQKLRAYTNMMGAMRKMRTSDNLVNTNELVDAVAGKRLTYDH